MSAAVWTLTVCPCPGELTTSIHRTHADALAWLSSGWDETGEFQELGKGDVVAGLREYADVAVDIEAHSVEWLVLR